MNLSTARTEALEAAYRSALVERELIKEICRYPVVPFGATQLAKLWKDEFYILLDGDDTQIAVYTIPDGIRLEAAVAERLASPEYAHFLTRDARDKAERDEKKRREDLALSEYAEKIFSK